MGSTCIHHLQAPIAVDVCVARPLRINPLCCHSKQARPSHPSIRTASESLCLTHSDIVRVTGTADSSWISLPLSLALQLFGGLPSGCSRMALARCVCLQDGFLLWQLLCLCTEYDLPKPLWRSIAKKRATHQIENLRSLAKVCQGRAACSSHPNEAVACASHEGVPLAEARYAPVLPVLLEAPTLRCAPLCPLCPCASISGSSTGWSRPGGGAKNFPLCCLRAVQFRLQAAAISYALLCHHEAQSNRGNSKDVLQSFGLLVTFA